MCYEPTARSPMPRIAGGAGPHESGEPVLEAADGNQFRAFAARTPLPDAPGIMILPDVRGLHPFYKDLAVRFAEAGVHATAMDYFGRTAGLPERGPDFDFRPHVEQMTPDGVEADTAATVNHMRSEDGGGAERVYSLGFCLGGRISFNLAARDLGLAGVIGFYGSVQGRGPDDPAAPTRLAERYRCPVLGLFGGADRSIPQEEIDRFRAALEEAGVKNQIVVYEGAPHSFFDRRFDQHREACEDAWGRMLAFMGRAA